MYVFIYVYVYIYIYIIYIYINLRLTSHYRRCTLEACAHALRSVEQTADAVEAAKYLEVSPYIYIY